MIISFSRVRGYVWAAWAIGSIFYAYQYIIRVMPNILLTDITEQFGVSAASFGQFSGIYYIGYSLAHLPIGIMLDRFGPRRVMSACILLTVLGLTPLLFAERWIYPVLGRLCIGIGSSAAILGLFKIIRMMFHEAQFTRMLSFAATIGLLGAIYGGSPVSYLRDTYGANAVIQILSVAGLLLALIAYWVIPNVKATPTTTVLSDIKEVLLNRRVIGICLSAGLMVGPLEGFADVWGAIFLKQVYGFEGSAAAGLSSTIFLGMCFGAPVLSYLAQKMKDDLLAIFGAGIVMLVIFLSLLVCPVTSTLLTAGFVLIGVASAYQILAIYKASTYVREQTAALTTAIANMIIMIFGYIFHSIMGSVIHAWGGHEEPAALVLGVAVIPCALFLGSLGFAWFWVQERRSKQKIA